jgi:hypothetical protein
MQTVKNAYFLKDHKSKEFWECIRSVGYTKIIINRIFTKPGDNATELIKNEALKWWKTLTFDQIKAFEVLNFTDQLTEQEIINLFEK